VHIRIADVRPAAPGDATINGQTNGFTLNLRFDAFGPPGCRSSEELRRRCIQSTAIHEFGHVLGFYHEEERDDYVAPRGLPDEHPCAKQSYQNPAKRLDSASRASVLCDAKSMAPARRGAGLRLRDTRLRTEGCTWRSSMPRWSRLVRGMLGTGLTFSAVVGMVGSILAALSWLLSGGDLETVRLEGLGPRQET
jgi:hypothetical protein